MFPDILYVAILLTLFSTYRKSGAIGSRLTGAGWGGCAVSLVPEDKLDSFLSEVKNGYKRYAEVNVKEALFATKPGGGAAIYTE